MIKSLYTTDSYLVDQSGIAENMNPLSHPDAVEPGYMDSLDHFESVVSMRPWHGIPGTVAGPAELELNCHQSVAVER